MVLYDLESMERLDSLQDFTAVPGDNDPQKVRLGYQTYLQASLKVYLKKIEVTFHVALPHLISKVERLDPAKRFSSGVFLVYVHLKESYEAKDLHLIFDTLQLLKSFSDEELYGINFAFSSVLTEKWEPPLMPHLRRAAPVDEEGKLMSQEIRVFPLVHIDGPFKPPAEAVESIRLIREGDRGLREEFDIYVSGIKFFSGRVLGGVTSPRFFGTIYLRFADRGDDPLLFYYESFIHECSHLHLYALMGNDPLVLNKESERYRSPLRIDKRPMFGLFHAAFVLARIVRGWRILTYKEKEKLIAKKLKDAEVCLKDVCQTITDHGLLTEIGRKLFQTLEVCAFGDSF